MDDKNYPYKASGFTSPIDNEPDSDGKVEIHDLASYFLSQPDKQVEVQLFSSDTSGSTHFQTINHQPNHQNGFDPPRNSPTPSNQQPCRVSATHPAIGEHTTAHSPSRQISPLADHSHMPHIPQQEPVHQSAQSTPVPVNYPNVAMSHAYSKKCNITENKKPLLQCILRCMGSQHMTNMEIRI